MAMSLIEKVAIGAVAVAAVGIGYYLLRPEEAEAATVPEPVPEVKTPAPSPYAMQPVIYKTSSARVARRMEAAAPGVVLTKQKVIVDESTGTKSVVVETIKPTTARQTELVQRSIVTPSTAVTRPGGGGAGRRLV